MFVKNVVYKKEQLKMIKIYKFILFILLISCSSSGLLRVSAKKPGIDPIFKPYIQSYRYIIGKELYSDRFERLSFNFASLKDDVVGRCWWLLNGELEIEIDTTWWYNTIFDEKAKEFVVYHELEHCIKYRMHTNKKEEIIYISDFFWNIGYYLGLIPKKGNLPDGCPGSLMHSHVMTYWCREKHYIYYLNEIRDYKPR